MGTGAIIASVHVDEDEVDDDMVVYSAAMAATSTSKPSNDAAIATKLLKSVKEDYEVRGSGVKPRPIGKTKEQLKANSSKEWASNSNVKPAKPGLDDAKPVNRQGLPAIIKINGVEAYTCWDSGSELDAISSDFTRAVGIKPTPKKNSLRIRLGTKGSESATSYESTPVLDFGNTKVIRSLDVVNLDRWDVLLGNPFCNQYGVVLDYKNRTIRFGNTTVKALSRDEEMAVRKGGKTPRLHAATQ